jgi:glycosyltransferase involved in cell wall biosynthesis
MSNEKIRLVLSGLPLANPHVGQGVYTFRLINALARRADINFAIVARPDVDLPKGLPRDKFIFLPKARTPKHDLLAQIFWSQRLLRFVAREFSNAIFHSPGPISGTLRPNRTIVTLHDCIYRRFPRYTGRFFARRLFLRSTERFAARSSMVLTDSEFSKKELITQAGIPTPRIDVLYPWVGSEYFQPVSNTNVDLIKRKLNLPERFWLYIGGYDYRKNIEFLLRAYAEASKKRRLPILVLAGEIPPLTRTTCDVHGTLNDVDLTDDQILLSGPILETDLPMLYRAASLFIFPSLMEGFGLPPAEAMAVGTPVLVSNKASLPEVVQTAHCLFDPTQLESLIAKLIAAAENERQFTAPLCDRFTEAYGVKRYLDLMNTVAEGDYVSS